MTSNNGASARPLADLLKEATAEDHRDAEGHAFQRDLVAGQVPRPALVAFGSGMLELVRAIEQRLPTEGAEWRDFRDAMAGHASRLEQDLDGLRNGETPPPPSPGVAAFVAQLGGEDWTAGTALGAFYVVEGSMNGNRYIRRALLGARPELAENLRYFDPYGEQQRERWQQFREAINRLGGTLDSPDEAVHAAHQTFLVSGTIASEVSADQPKNS